VAAESTPSPGDTIDGVFTGRAGVEKRYTALFKLWHFEDHLNTLDQVHTPFATVPWAVGGYEVTAAGAHYKGFRILTYVSAPDGKAWLVSNEVCHHRREGDKQAAEPNFGYFVERFHDRIIGSKVG
jgi:hypothetical protein